jgi:hypothetical protein
LAAESTAAAPPRAEPEDPEVLLERERRGRGRAAVAAAIAAVLPLAGASLRTVLQGDLPNNDPGVLLYIDDHATVLIASSALVGFGSLAIAYTLVFLFDATRGRRPEIPRLARTCAQYAPFVLLVALIAQQVGLVTQAHHFATTGDQTYEEAKDALGAPGLTAAAALQLVSQLGLGFALAMISLNAMRAGLLTRYMGIVGIGVAVLTLLPLGGVFGIGITFLWFGALALLLAGRWPGGQPPAWVRGEAIPWPSQQELRERAALERGEREEPPEPEPEPESEPVPASADGSGHPSSKKRKRKRRR